MRSPCDEQAADTVRLGHLAFRALWQASSFVPERRLTGPLSARPSAAYERDQAAVMPLAEACKAGRSFATSKRAMIAPSLNRRRGPMLIRPLLVISLLLCVVPAHAADAPASPYLFDLLKQKPYLAAWNAMLAGAGVPAWVKNYQKTFDGPSSRSKDLRFKVRSIRSAGCARRMIAATISFHVLFAPGAAQAWGLLTTSGQQKWLGNPNTRGSKRRSTATSNNRIHHAFCDHGRDG